MKMHRTNLCLPLILVEGLRKASKERGISFAELVRRILGEWVDSQEDGNGR